jgi:GNAT superfamily N-acetyltransferase
MDGRCEWIGSDQYVVSTDPARLDVDRIHQFLYTAYWSTGIPREVVERSIANSVPFGLYAPSREQVGFARVVTDRATYAYLGDVYVETAHRGRGLGKFLVSCVLDHPDLQGLRRWALATADAHTLYARHGFTAPAHPEMHLFIERAPADLWPAPGHARGDINAADRSSTSTEGGESGVDRASVEHDQPTRFTPTPGRSR